MVRWRAGLSSVNVDPVDEDNRREFDEPCILVIGEGKSDAAFLRRLCKDRGIAGLRLAFPSEETAGGGGKTQFGNYLSRSVTRPGFGRYVHGVVIVADNDSANAFRDAADQVPTETYSLPLTAGVIARDADRIPSSVFLVPDNSDGCLETLIIQSSSWDAAKNQCLDDYKNCSVGAVTWSQAHADKFRLRCVVAATCTDPECSTSMLWKKDKKGLPFDIKHAAFDPLVTFLRGALVDRRP